MYSTNTVLLLCYEFPPYQSIGGRRWAKFAKYLARRGYTVQVIAAKYPFPQKNTSNWQNDIEDSHIKVHQLESLYPYRIFQSSNTIFNRMLRKSYSFFIQYSGSGIVQDKALFWKKNLLQLAHQLINQHRIQNVISTGPPHRVNYYAALLKERNPDLNIICDFRDTWLDGKVYGLPPQRERVLKVEARMEAYTVRQADYLLFTYQPMLEDFTRRYPCEAMKFKHFPHNYDPEDYPGEVMPRGNGGKWKRFAQGIDSLQSEEGKDPSFRQDDKGGEINKNSVVDKKARNDKSKIKFIYGGTVTSSAVRGAFIPFLQALIRLKEKDNPLYERLEVVIYGENAALGRAISDLSLEEIVQLKEKIPEEAFYGEAAKSNYLLSFLGRDWKDFITTKHIAFLPFRKPIVLVAQKGGVSHFIEDNKIGFLINPQNAFEDLYLLLKEEKLDYLKGINNFDLMPYSYNEATNSLISLFK